MSTDIKKNGKIIMSPDKIPEFRKGKEKVRFRSSNIKHYFVCPKKFMLSTTCEIPLTDMMRNGLIFEGTVLGWKDENLREVAIGRKETKDGKKNESLIELEQRADYVRPLFLGGEAYKGIYIDTKDYRLTGEVDYHGWVNHKGNELFCLADLKYTSDIERQWNYLDQKEELLQSVIYPYIMYKKTGVILPFLYIIVENKYEFPLVKFIKITCELDDFLWLEKQIKHINSDLYYVARPDISTCLGSYSQRCSFLPYCTEGRNLVAQHWEIRFAQLKSE